MQKPKESDRLKIDAKTREAFKSETHPAVRKEIERLRRWRDRSNHIFPEYP